MILSREAGGEAKADGDGLAEILMHDAALFKPFIFIAERDGRLECIELSPPLTEEMKGVIEDVKGHFLSQGKPFTRDLKEVEGYVRKRKLLEKDNLPLNALKYFIRRDVFGYGEIDGLMRQPSFEDISVTPSGVVYVYHPDYGTMQTNVTADKDRLIQKFAWMTGKTPTFSSPVVRATLPEEGRVNIVLERVSKTGSAVHLRRRSRLLSVIDLLANETLPASIASELWTLMSARKTIVIIGPPSAGKTTLLNALLFLLPQDTHAITIEDPPELRLYHEQWEQLTPSTRLESREATPITYDDILTFVLQSRPGYVVIGEIHQDEIDLFTQLLNVPFLCSATFHAETPENMVERLTSKPMNMPRHLLKYVDVVVKMGMRFRGKIIRRVEGVYYQEKDQWVPRWLWSWKENAWIKSVMDFPPLEEALEQLEVDEAEPERREKFLLSCPTGLEAREDFDAIQSYFRGPTPEVKVKVSKPEAEVKIPLAARVPQTARVKKPMRAGPVPVSSKVVSLMASEKEFLRALRLAYRDLAAPKEFGVSRRHVSISKLREEVCGRTGMSEDDFNDLLFETIRRHPGLAELVAVPYGVVGPHPSEAFEFEGRLYFYIKINERVRD